MIPRITTIIIPASTFVKVSIADFAFFTKNTAIATAPANMYPAFVGIPSSVLNPSAPPPTLPMLNTRPPSATMNATK